MAPKPTFDSDFKSIFPEDADYVDIPDGSKLLKGADCDNLSEQLNLIFFPKATIQAEIIAIETGGRQT